MPPKHLGFGASPWRKLNVILVFILITILSASYRSDAWISDNRNGTFTNPVLNADYPDPDIIRVGDDFYMISTTFVSIPGIEILHSNDLINWNIAGYALNSMDFDQQFNLIGGNHYGGGMWAASIRYHNGMFYILDNIMGAGPVVLRSPKPTGPWKMNRLKSWFQDPGLMFDDDGTPLVYHGTGGHLWLAVLDPELTKVVSNNELCTIGYGAEGSHAYKINGKYYICSAVFGEYPKIICSRSENRTGPFTTVVICDNHIPWASPHQGGIVQLANGDWWGFSLKDSGAVGRDLWIGPVTWSDGWPYFGDPKSPSIPQKNKMPIQTNIGNAPGYKSNIRHNITHLQSSDEFNNTKLNPQWQWNHNPDNSKWSLTAHKGYLRLYTQKSPNFSNARNTITLRTEGPACTGIIKIDTSHLQMGDRAGICLLEQRFGYIAVLKTAAGLNIIRAVNKNEKLDTPSEDNTNRVENIKGAAIWLSIHCNFNNQMAQFSYSTDGKNYMLLGDRFPMHFTMATFQGDRFGIFNYNPNDSTGWLDIDYFHLAF